MAAPVIEPRVAGCTGDSSQTVSSGDCPLLVWPDDYQHLPGMSELAAELPDMR